jgi:hypothetical protein
MPRRILTLFALVVTIFCIGCSSGTDNPVTPADQNIDYSPLISDNSADNTGRTFLGVWDVEFDIESNTAVVKEARTNSVHYNILPYIPAPGITVKSYNPTTGILVVDVKLQNPYTISVNDVRLIVYTDGVIHKIQNPDDWTDLFDIPYGLPINPFMAYAKADPTRTFFGNTSETVSNISIMCGGNFNVKIAVDASIGGNCREPYEISNFNASIMYDQFMSPSTVTVDVYDWQGDTAAVYLYCPGLLGAAPVPLTNITGIQWGATVYNNMSAPSAYYAAYLFARSGGGTLYDEVFIRVIPRDWAYTWGDTNADAGNDVASDQSGNIYVTGRFLGNVDFDPGIGVDIHTGNGQGSAFLCKFDRNGNYLWTRTWGGWGMDQGYGVAVDQYGGIYVCGQYEQMIDFDPSGNNDWHSSNGGSDAFLCKYWSDGTFLWAKTWGGNGTFGENAWSVACDPFATGIYVTGQFDGTVDFNPAGGSQYSKTIGGSAPYLSKFDANGNFQWANAWCTENDPSISGLGQDVITDGQSYGKVYVVGFFGGNTDFDPSGGVDMHQNTGGTWDGFLAKYASDGSFFWADSWDGVARGVTFDVADAYGYIYVTGDFSGTVDFDPDSVNTDFHTSGGNWDAYLSKFNISGTHQWAVTWGGPDNIWGEEISIDLFYGTSIFVTGPFEQTADFDPGTSNYPLTSAGMYDAFTVKIDNNGNFVWARAIGGTGDDRAYGVAADNILLVFNTGYFSGVADFDSGPGMDNHMSNGATDAYLKKYQF